jgi:phenylalanyl-tRNA synthetase alpha subunit
VFGKSKNLLLSVLFFPFTEPSSAEIDIYWGLKKQRQITELPKELGWLEIGCMVDPNVLKNCGINPEESLNGLHLEWGERIANVVVPNYIFVRS